MNVPVIFVRENTRVAGNFIGLPIALKCAKRWNERVILIGCDQQPQSVRDLAEFHPMKDYNKGKQALEAAWPFGHLGESWFLLASLAAWLPVYEFCEQHKIKFAAVVDNDVLVFDNMTEASKPWIGAHYCACNPCGTAQGPTLVTLDALRGFADFIVRLYQGTLTAPKECWDASKCSMGAWAWYSRLNPHLPVGNLCDIVDGVTYDHNWAMGYNGFEHDGRGKIAQFRKGQPYVRRIHDGKSELVRFVLIHAWGDFKQAMPEFMKRSDESLLV